MKFTSLTPGLIVSLLILCTLHPVAAQRSYRYENFGNRSVLLNGNVTGSVTDLGGVFYNPARLALVENPAFSVEGRFYERSNVQVDDFLGADTNIENKEFNGLPGLMAGGVTLGNETFYYSFLLRNRMNINSEFDTGIQGSENTDFIPPGWLFNAEAGVKIDLREEWFGLSWAKKLSDHFSIGISTFLSFYNYSGSDDFAFILFDGQQNALQFDGSLNYSQASTGLFTKVAAAWNINPISMGLTVDLPYLEFRDDSSFNSKDIFTDKVNDQDAFTINQFAGLLAKRRVPYGINFGLGLPLGKSTLHLNTDWHAGQDTYERIAIPPLESETEPVSTIEATEKLNPVWNVGLGAEIYINEKVNTYLSITTDHSPLDPENTIFKDGNNFGEANILTLDYVHYGGGVSLNFKSFSFTAGAIRSSGSGDFERVITLPFSGDNLTNPNLKVNVDRWRFLVGLNLSVNN